MATQPSSSSSTAAAVSAVAPAAVVAHRGSDLDLDDIGDAEDYARPHLERGLGEHGSVRFYNKHEKANAKQSYWCYPTRYSKHAIGIGFGAGCLMMILLLIFNPGNGDADDKVVGWTSFTKTCRMMNPGVLPDHDNATYATDFTVVFYIFNSFPVLMLVHDGVVKVNNHNDTYKPPRGFSFSKSILGIGVESSASSNSNNSNINNDNMVAWEDGGNMTGTNVSSFSSSLEEYEYDHDQYYTYEYDILDVPDKSNAMDFEVRFREPNREDLVYAADPRAGRIFMISRRPPPPGYTITESTGSSSSSSGMSGTEYDNDNGPFHVEQVDAKLEEAYREVLADAQDEKVTDIVPPKTWDPCGLAEANPSVMEFMTLQHGNYRS